jgi:hypothetical protein
MAKQCTRCGSVKETTQFSKRTNSKDGLQSHCKECNIKANQLFRNQLNPNYMTDWYSNNRPKWNEYINDYSRAGDTNTIYAITSPNSYVYIGHSQRKKRFRLSEHKRFYRTSHKNKLPLLWESFDRYGINNHTFEVLTQFKGTKEEGMAVETKLIQFYKSINKSLNKNN